MGENRFLQTLSQVLARWRAAVVLSSHRRDTVSADTVWAVSEIFKSTTMLVEIKEKLHVLFISL